MVVVVTKAEGEPSRDSAPLGAAVLGGLMRWRGDARVAEDVLHRVSTDATSAGSIRPQALLLRLPRALTHSSLRFLPRTDSGVVALLSALLPVACPPFAPPVGVEAAAAPAPDAPPPPPPSRSMIFCGPADEDAVPFFAEDDEAGAPDAAADAVVCASRSASGLSGVDASAPSLCARQNVSRVRRVVGVGVGMASWRFGVGERGVIRVGDGKAVQVQRDPRGHLPACRLPEGPVEDAEWVEKRLRGRMSGRETRWLVSECVERGGCVA